jgi:hypothetical protein
MPRRTAAARQARNARDAHRVVIEHRLRTQADAGAFLRA